MSTFSHLAIGSEITIGQILNTNSQWLSQQGQKIGLNPLYHLACNDDFEQIEKACIFLKSNSQVIIVTGGLGPTIDDFTRQVISKVTQTPLEWHEGAWESLKNYLTKREIPVRESHKQECFIPKGALVFYNKIGTASSFIIQDHQNIWIVLPGPPREVQYIWPEIESFLIQNVKSLKKFKFESIHIFGLPESAVAERIEKITSDCPFEKSYRIHIPYIEFKLKYPEEFFEEVKKWMNQIKLLFTDTIVLSDLSEIEEQICKKFLQSKKFSFHQIYFLNPQKSKEIQNLLQNRFKKINFINLSFDELQINKNNLYISFTISNDFSLELDLFSTTYKNRIVINSNLNSQHSSERKYKDLIERGLLKLADFNLISNNNIL